MIYIAITYAICILLTFTIYQKQLKVEDKKRK